MTNHMHTTNLSRWDDSFVDFDIAKAAAEAIVELPASRARERIFEVLTEAKETIFSIAAPSLGGLAMKLELYWGDRLFDPEDYAASMKQMIIGDLRRLERQLAGVEEPEASGGMDPEKVAGDWTEALREHGQYALFLADGPPEKWHYSKRSDIVALKDEAEAKVLSLPAPQLDAVIRKLELLWADDRFDPVFSTVDHARILRDLHRLAVQRPQCSH